MKIGIIGPTENEVIPFIKDMVIKEILTQSMLTFYTGTYEAMDIVALFCGVCKVNAAIATQILIDKYNITHIIVIGVAGAIDQSLKIGDTVLSTKLAYHDVDDGILTEYHPFMKSIYINADNNLLTICQSTIANNDFEQNVFFGPIVTGEAFISKQGRDGIKTKYQPLCVDMESTSIAHVCYVNNIPFLAIRTISDTEEECGIEVFEKNCISAALRSIDFLKKFIKELSLAKSI